MMAVAILNLLSSPILVTWSIFSSDCLHFCKNCINLPQSVAELLLSVQKSKMAANAILNFIFV